MRAVSQACRLYHIVNQWVPKQTACGAHGAWCHQWRNPNVWPIPVMQFDVHSRPVNNAINGVYPPIPSQGYFLVRVANCPWSC